MHNRFRDILLMRKTGKVISDSSMFDKRLGLYLNDRDYGEVITTVTGNPISIVTNRAQNAISAILSFSPKQTGTGNPSPDNIMPIEGWTEANLFGCGKNIFDKNSAAWKVGYVINAEGVETENNSYTCIENYIPVEANKNYVFSGNLVTVGTFNSVALYDKNKTFLYREQGKAGQPAKFTTPNNAAFIRFNANKGAVRPDTIQIEIGTQATNYEPFNGTETAISLGGTYYRFTVDMVSGTLTVTSIAEVYDGTEDWILMSESRGYYLIFSEGRSNQSLLVSSCLRGVSAASSASMPLNSIMLNRSTGKNLLCRVDTVTDFPTLDSWKAFLAQNPMTVVFPLTEPITYTLTPTEIALLAGANMLWTDGDSLSVTYKAPKA